jgi:hypothetical protein
VIPAFIGMAHRNTEVINATGASVDLHGQNIGLAGTNAGCRQQELHRHRDGQKN